MFCAHRSARFRAKREGLRSFTRKSRPKSGLDCLMCHIRSTARAPCGRAGCVRTGSWTDGLLTGFVPEDKGLTPLTPNTVELIPTLGTLFPPRRARPTPGLHRKGVRGAECGECVWGGVRGAECGECVGLRTECGKSPPRDDVGAIAPERALLVHRGEGARASQCEDRVLDGSASGGKGSNGGN